MLDKRTSLIVLNGLPGIGPATVRRLCRDFPEYGAIFENSRTELSKLGYLGDHAIESLVRWSHYIDIEKELRLTESCGVSIVTIEDGTYPEYLREIHDPPICLYVRGSLECLGEGKRSIAIVGSRNTTSYGLHAAAELARGASLAGWVVVSGLARGIDTEAHRTVVSAGGRTIAVLGSGLCEIYPPEGIPLARDICGSGGAIISEYPLHFKPDRYSFPIRNRIISGLSRGTIVIEAGLQSGSLITATHAIEQGRSVFAVPGRIDSPHSRGCHALLRDGAILTENFQDILDEFSLLPFARSESAARHRTSVPALPAIELNSDEMLIWSELGEEPVQLDELVSRLDMPVSTLLSSVLLMEIKHAIIQQPGKYFIRNGKVSVKASTKNK